jgi:hypothetical protein
MVGFSHPESTKPSAFKFAPLLGHRIRAGGIKSLQKAIVAKIVQPFLQVALEAGNGENSTEVSLIH